MAKLTKRQQAFQGKEEAGKVYPAVEALNLVRQNATAKFDESVDVAIQLGILIRPFAVQSSCPKALARLCA